MFIFISIFIIVIVIVIIITASNDYNTIILANKPGVKTVFKQNQDCFSKQFQKCFFNWFETVFPQTAKACGVLTSFVKDAHLETSPRPSPGYLRYLRLVT